MKPITVPSASSAGTVARSLAAPRLAAFVLAAASLVASPAAAGQGVVVQDVSIPSLFGGLGQHAGTSWSGSTGRPFSAAIPKFPACPSRTLQDVRVELAATNSSGISVTGQQGAQTFVNAQLSSTMSVSMPAFNGGASFPIQTAGNIALTSQNGYQSGATLSPAASANVNATLPAAALKLFVGTGNVTLNGVVSHAQSFNANPAPVSAQFFCTTSFSLRVTYTYATPRQDVTGDSMVDAADLAAVLSSWGSTSGGFTDVDQNGTVGPEDLAAILSAWGPAGCN